MFNQFRELRDTGAPDTGPKRPKNQRIVSLTPSGAASSGRGGRSSGGRGRERGGREKERERGGREKEREGGGRKEERDSRKEGRGGRRGRGRRSLGAQTPRTRLRTDIRDLITSEQHNTLRTAPLICTLTTAPCMNQEVQGKCITNKATPTRTTPFSKEKGAALGGTRTHDTPLTRQSALPTLRIYALCLAVDKVLLREVM